MLLIVIRCLSDQSSLVLCLYASAVKRNRFYINNVLYLQAREARVGMKTELLAPATITRAVLYIAGALILQPYPCRQLNIVVYSVCPSAG